MTIGELYAKLGFKIEGAEDLKKVEADLKQAFITTTKLAVGVDALGAAFIGLINSAMGSAVGFQKFGLATGLSTAELQRFQYQAALANVSLQEVDQAVRQVQMAGMRVSATGEGFGAWALLGIDPRQNPFEVFRRLQTELVSIDTRRVAAARYITSQAGIGDNMFQFLRRGPGPELPGKYLLAGKELEALQDLNREWQKTYYLIGKVKDRAGGELAKPVQDMLMPLERGVSLLANFVDWMSRGTPAAQALKEALFGLGKGITILGASLTAIAIGAGAGKGIIALLGLPAAPELAIIAGTTAAFVGLTAAIRALMVAWAELHGKTFTEHDLVAMTIGKLLPGLMRTFPGLLPKVPHISPFRVPLNQPMETWKMLQEYRPPVGSRATHIDLRNTFNINAGGQNPERIGTMIATKLQDQINAAVFSAEAGML